MLVVMNGCLFYIYWQLIDLPIYNMTTRRLSFKIGDVMPIQVIPEMWESATMIMLGKYKNGEIWSEGSGTTPCPSTCLT